MFPCHNCGAQLTSGARFCAACGAPADQEATRLAPPQNRPRVFPQEAQLTPARVEPLPAPPTPAARAEQHPSRQATEKTIFVVRPTLLFVGLGYVAAALAAVLLVVLLSLLPLNLSPFISVPLSLSILLVPAFYHLRRNRVEYTLTDSKIIIDRGFISRTTSNIPLRNIQNVTVSSTLIQRLLRFGDLVIHDASELGSHVVLDNIPDPRRHADLLLRELRHWR